MRKNDQCTCNKILILRKISWKEARLLASTINNGVNNVEGAIWRILN